MQNLVVVPYTFRKAKFKDDNIQGYWITLYCFFDGQTVHSFFHQSDMLENSCFAHECGVSTSSFYHDILVTESIHSDIFQQIEEYVHGSHHD